jgi:5-keto 4-deoxyuronate isomerase
MLYGVFNMGKKGVFTRVDEALLLEFKEYLLRKYGKLDGVFSRELENALRFYLERRAHTYSAAHTHKKAEDEKPKSRTLKTVKAISEKLSEYREVTDQDIEDVIVKTVGGDHRTVSKYTYLLKKLGVIEPSRRIPGSSGWIYMVQPRPF